MLILLRTSEPLSELAGNCPLIHKVCIYYFESVGSDGTMYGWPGLAHRSLPYKGLTLELDVVSTDLRASWTWFRADWDAVTGKGWRVTCVGGGRGGGGGWWRV